jgi:hypothetical protein
MDQRSTIELLHKTLQDQNFDVRKLTTAEGLGNEIPKDAAAVFVIGPTSPFSEAEAKSLTDYAQKGGRLFLALDPEASLAFDELLKPLGLSFKPQPLAQERGTANVRPPPGLADRVNIGSNTFSSHPAVSYLGRTNAPVLMLAAGGLEELPQHPAELSLDFAVRSRADAWNDANNNFEFDQGAGETKKSWGLVVAVERRAKSNKPWRVPPVGLLPPLLLGILPSGRPVGAAHRVRLRQCRHRAAESDRPDSTGHRSPAIKPQQQARHPPHPGPGAQPAGGP